jgi:hypothetical protein
MDKMLEIQRKIFTEPEARKAFAADPRAFLAKEGVVIPEGVSVPKSLPLPQFEQRITQVEKQLKEKGVDVAHLKADDLQKAGLINIPEMERLGKTDDELSEDQLQTVAGGRIATVKTAAGVAVLVVVVTVGIWSVL